MLVMLENPGNLAMLVMLGNNVSSTCGWCRQARRTLLGLLHYDPMTKQETEAGYGAGSGKPDVMFGFLKHMWGIGDRVEAFHRCVLTRGF